MTNLTGEGEVAAQFPIYRLDLNGEPFERVAACNTIDEVLVARVIRIEGTVSSA
jgi:hypothetical protein